jgi:preprotein translocase subunit SecA
MNQQREVIYSLRSFALEGGEELRGEAIKMVEKAVDKRVRSTLSDTEEEGSWDVTLLKQDLLMHYLLTVPELQTEDTPTTVEAVATASVEAAKSAFAAKEESLNAIKDEDGHGFSSRLLSLVMLNVLDEKWKDHLYDLDQLRSAIHYRSWGQKDPLIEYKQEAYTMFVDLMSDIHHTFTERFLRAQLVFNPSDFGRDAAPARSEPQERPKPTKRYNALGVLEDIPADEPVETSADDNGRFDQGDGPEPTKPVASPAKAKRSDPIVVGAGRARSLSDLGGSRGSPGAASAPDYSSVGRNDPCPCGSGKKFKKCHGA